MKPHSVNKIKRNRGAVSCPETGSFGSALIDPNCQLSAGNAKNFIEVSKRQNFSQS